MARHRTACAFSRSSKDGCARYRECNRSRTPIASRCAVDGAPGSISKARQIANATADAQAVSTGYFGTLDVPLVRGRRLTASDRHGEPAVAVVNLAFERRYLNGENAIGHRFRRGSGQPWVTIVGVVNDIRRGGKTQDINPQIYLAAAQTELYPTRLADFAVRTANDPYLLLKAIQQQVWAIDKDQPVTGVRTMQEIVDRSVSEQRFQMLLLMVFAGIAAVLAVIGISGVLTYSVRQRRNEIGVRIALGATPGRIVNLVLRQALAMIAAGVALGVSGALVLTRLVANLLFRVQPNDAATYAGAVGLLVAVALAAALIPRAARGAAAESSAGSAPLRW